MNRGGADLAANRYELEAYTLMDADLGLHPWGGAEHGTLFYLSVRNALDTRFAYPGFQPHYRADVPGEPRMITIGVRHGL